MPWHSTFDPRVRSGSSGRADVSGGSTCTNGHVSEWDDYCSVCGESLSGEQSSPEAEVAESGAPEAAATTCPNCSEATGAADVFCENCGYDFLAGTLPDSGASAPRSTDLPAGETSSVAVVSVDLEFFERMQFGGVEPPSEMPAVVRVELPPTDILVGRHSESRGTFPEVDLGSIFGESDATDPAVSSNHCRLHRTPTGWTVTDLGSTNGTFLGDSEQPIAPGAPVELDPGTAIHLGAWTRIEFIDG